MHFPPIIQRMGKDKQGIRRDRHRVPARLFVDSENVDSRFKKREAPVQLQTSFFYMFCYSRPSTVIKRNGVNRAKGRKNFLQ